jgi:serine/threonine-protein kinase RsbT
MTVASSEKLELTTEPDIVSARRKVRDAAAAIHFSLVNQTKLVTAASELARNTLIYGGGGHMLLEVLNGERTGIRLTFEDKGPGIADIETSLRDGFTTGSGLGLGLGGSKRLVNEFEITSKIGEGTRIVIVKWK